MHLDRWREVVGQIKDNFSVEEHELLDDPEVSGGIIEFVVFNGPLGRLKLVFSNRPKVLDKKITYSNRIGSESVVEYIYSPTETVSQLLVYRWSEADDDWAPLDGQNIFN